MADEFCLKMPDFHVTFRDLLHAVNLRHGTNGFTSLLKEGVLRIFSPWKIQRLQPGLNPQTWVPTASTLPLDHRSRSVCCKNTPCVVTFYFKLQCYRHCLLLEENLTRIAKETAAKGANCFPIIVGKRPSVFGGKENVVNIKPEKCVSHMPEVQLLHHLHFVYSFFSS